MLRDHDYVASKLWTIKEAEIRNRIGTSSASKPRLQRLRAIYAKLATRSISPTRSIITFKQADKSSS